MIRRLSLILFVVSLLLFGLLEYTYVINFTNFDLDFFIKRNSFSHDNYQIRDLLSGENPHLYSMLFYLISNLLLCSSFIGYYFKSKSNFKTSLILCSIALAGLVLSTLVLYGIGQSSSAKFVFTDAKNGLSSPFLACFLFVVFYIKDKKILNQD